MRALIEDGRLISSRPPITAGGRPRQSRSLMSCSPRTRDVRFTAQSGPSQGRYRCPLSVKSQPAKFRTTGGGRNTSQARPSPPLLHIGSWEPDSFDSEPWPCGVASRAFTSGRSPGLTDSSQASAVGATIGSRVAEREGSGVGAGYCCSWRPPLMTQRRPGKPIMLGTEQE
jgi:hypothetical protein